MLTFGNAQINLRFRSLNCIFALDLKSYEEI